MIFKSNVHEWHSDSVKLVNASDGACFVGVCISLVILIKPANILSNIPEVKVVRKQVYSATHSAS